MFKKRDWLFLTILFVLGIIATIIIYRPASSRGSDVVVKENGRIIASYSLSKNATYPIQQGAETNTLTIKDGYASITSANCHDKLCVNQGRINKSGESIICLPHQLSIEIESGEGKDIDGISK